ncbi:hypothetical protein AWB67_05095 [Caballeronia terrestris]|uniref:Uncharacterized protein n=1 Tax=Caballeronia terrestris TaxID=1226301 RepID=A0A158KA90_9BURK|nr:hypothetical protein [Caballeronia terrestris]SAL77460.1 hypothetical protein AWB67_05095 [Caballeronia terrestris]
MKTIARVFVSQIDAEAARRALIDARVSSSAIEMAFQGDEAGPPRGNFLTGDSVESVGNEDEYDARFRVMGESSRFILTARVEDDNVANAEAALARIGGQTINSVSGSALPVSKG